MQKMITFNKPGAVIFEFEVRRNNQIYLGRYLTFRKLKIIVVWSKHDRTDCDFIILKGKGGLKHDDSCCCEKCSLACGKCIGGVCCCFVCGKKRDAKRGKCGCGKFSCIKRVAKVYYGSSSSDDEHKAVEDDPTRPNLDHEEHEEVVVVE